MPHIELIITTAIAGAVGWLVKEGFGGIKSLINLLKTYQKESREWRETMTRQVDTINDSLVCVMRGDLIHKAHRYVDDKGYASLEEKESWHEEWTQYQSICPRNGFIDALAEQVMSLPEHPTGTDAGF